VYIGHDGPSGEVLWGTGFLVQVPGGEVAGGKRWWTYLVTASHVADKLTGTDFWFRANDASGKAAKIYRGDSDWAAYRWWKHPDGEPVDVAVHPFIMPEGYELGALPTQMFVTETENRHAMGLGDEVIIVGLFAYAAGKHRITPITRTGTVAMVPPEPLPTRRGPMDAYLIEARSIGGLSGSPVFVRPTQALGMFGLSLQGVSEHLYLLGLMHGHWDINESDINEPLPRTKEGGVNVGIAIVVPATKILETINQPRLVELRARIEQHEAERGLPTPDIVPEP
jgi:hypothetical protein